MESWQSRWRYERAVNPCLDGSDTTIAGFEAIGLNADEMAAKFAQGGESAKEAFYEVMSGLSEMKDPLAQNVAGVTCSAPCGRT